MVHLGARAFDEINGEVVQTTTFIKTNKYIKKYVTPYIRLVNINSEYNQEKALRQVIVDHESELYFEKKDNVFQKIPGIPIAYWVSDQLAQDFDNANLGDIACPRQGICNWR